MISLAANRVRLLWRGLQTTTFKIRSRFQSATRFRKWDGAPPVSCQRGGGPGFDYNQSTYFTLEKREIIYAVRKTLVTPREKYLLGNPCRSGLIRSQSRRARRKYSCDCVL